MKNIGRYIAGCFMLACSTLIMAIEEPPQVHFVVKSFIVTGTNPLSDNETEAILRPYIGDHYGLEGIQTAAETLESILRKAGYSFYQVNLVPQELKDGVIRLNVTKFKVDLIVVDGNKHYSTKNILNNAPTLKKNATPNTNVLSRAINMANARPSKDITLQFSESKAGGAIKAKLIVVDSKPDFFFVGLNNTGTKETGDFRLTGGYQFNNLFDADHSMSFSYTLSPDEVDAVSQYGFTYGIPFYESGGLFNLLISHSDVDSGIVEQQFDISGKGTVVSLRYNKLFLQTGTYKQELELGLDRKHFEDDIQQLQLGGGASISLGGDIVSRPVSVSYKGSRLSTTSNIDFSLGFFSNISGGTNNEDLDYADSRVGVTSFASADWSLFRYNLNYLRFLKQDWLLRFGLLGQQTSDLLIPGEQFGVGGMNSIRGYDERDVLGDTGYQVNIELWFPAFSAYKIRPLAFLDFGHTETLDPLPTTLVGVEAEQDPASIGAGLRYTWKEQLNAALDVGYAGKDAGTAKKGDVRAHLNVFYKF